MMRRSKRNRGYVSRARARLASVSLWAALAVLVIVATPSVLGAADEEASGTVWTAQAGELFPDESLQINQFLPSDITVVQGDTVVWNRMMFHTITLLSGEPRMTWLQPLKDGRLGIIPQVGFPSGVQNRTELEPISIASWARDRLGLLEPSKEKLVVNGNNEYGGTGFFNSGAPFDPDFLPRPVHVTFTQPGVYQVVCLIHSNMQATVTVLQEGFTAPESQADLDARAERERTSLIAHAESLFAASQEAGSRPRPDLTTEHRLKTGLFQDDVEYARYFPSDLEISAGDTVTWDWVNGGDTPHTVTFLSGAEAPEYLLVEHKVFADGSLNVRDPPTIAVNPEVFEPSGSDTYSGSGVFNSGVLFGEQGPPGRPTTYSLSFDTPGTYRYHCLMHGPVMSGTITVAGAALAPPALPSVGDGSMPALVGLAAAASALLLLGAGVLVVRWRRSGA